MPEYRMTYKRCCICGKKFPITREAHGSPLEFINSQPCKCADCQGEKNVAVNTKTDRKYLNGNSERPIFKAFRLFCVMYV
jgi:hypothetical protein